MRVQDIINKIEEFAPPELAYDWDNTGFITGNRDKEVKKIFVTLDMFKSTVDEAVRCGADMIISHHPILFQGINKIDYTSQQGYIVKELIKHDIALYASHTSTDCTRGGINDVLAAKLGIENGTPIEKNKLFDGCGLGRIGKLSQKLTLREYASFVAQQLHTPFVRVCGDMDRVLDVAAVGGGGCGELISEAFKLGADVLVTADLKYHICADAVEMGIALIDAGHYPTEVFVQEIFKELFADTDVELITSSHKDVFQVINS